MSQPNKSLKELQAIWYAKAKASGFNDIEQDEEHLKYWDTYRFKRLSPVRFAAKEDYYRLAGQFLHDHAFEKPFDKAVWELHCEGKSVREIIEILKTKRFTAYKNKVQDAIERISGLMAESCSIKKR